MRKSFRLAGLTLAVILGSAGSAGALWFITDMFDQRSIKPQEGTPVRFRPAPCPSAAAGSAPT